MMLSIAVARGSSRQLVLLVANLSVSAGIGIVVRW